MTPRTAVLVIAAVHQPVYRHYVRSYWTEMIRHADAECPDLDVYLLIENGMPRDEFAGIEDNVIEDPDCGFASRVARRHRRPGIPGILSKTVHALDVLAGDYDLFFRTNLSSMVMPGPFLRFVRDRPDIGYSGAWVWEDALRSDLVTNRWVGAGRPVEDLAVLDDYPGNTFVSGSGFFLSAGEAAELVARRGELRWDIPDDVSVGLMLERHERLDRFAMVLRPDLAVADMVERLRATDACHVRLQHFPVEAAEALWRELERDPLWP